MLLNTPYTPVPLVALPVPPPPLISKSLTHPPEPTILLPHTSSGILKRNSHQNPLRRKQRLRLEAGRTKAENVLERTKVKMIDSEGRGARKKRRRGEWKDIDGMIEREAARETMRKERRKLRNRNGLGRSVGVSPGAECEEWKDEMDVGEGGKGMEVGNEKLVIHDEKAAVEATDVEDGAEENEDEIL
ncbi:uncharacterized protein KY384_004899 [Bacidia gigantensis]|uniref:uncharacterized protein n=1 Tax=Bacidia gigantensis TaxID=2732470 RepID=UPI001D036685|nr:uncharacterized protein KY384_004899 [Bacidia gigantensis]KAG8530397.1 hypothetical protein KY384_004899 [Bacidia gigantensis]